MTILNRHLCPRCGAAKSALTTPAQQRECIEELRQALAAAEESGDDPRTAAIAQDRLLRDGYLPDDCELLLREAEWCVCSMNGVGDFSSGMGARYQACINKFERLRLAAAALDATSRTAMIRRRRLLWRIAAGSPLRPALRLLGSLVTILSVHFARVIQSRLGLHVGKVAAAPSTATVKIHV